MSAKQATSVKAKGASAASARAEGPLGKADKAKPAEPPDEEDAGEDQPMTFWEHLDELRSRLVKSVVVFLGATAIGWYYHVQLMAFLIVPFQAAWKEQGLPGEGTLHFGAPAVPFSVYFKLSMIAGAMLASPFIFHQLWAFVAPGLYAREKRFVIPFVGCSTLLFVGGAYFAYRTAVPISLAFFLGLAGPVGAGEASLTITPTVMMGEYVEYIGYILLGFGLIFELPLLMLFLGIAGVITHLHLIHYGRWFVLVAFVLGAVLTPPDITSQLIMAVPMCLLYLVSIGLVYVFGKRPTEAQRQAFAARRAKDRSDR